LHLRNFNFQEVGERIAREEVENDRADYGQEIIKNISIDLEIHERTLYRILKFYRTYPILTTVLSELSWSHYLLLMDINNFEQRKFYEIQVVKESWIVRELKKRLNNHEFEKAKKKGEITITLPIHLPSPEEVFKENYNWDFISLDEKHSEKELENALLDNIQEVLLEFGTGFAFMARQQKIIINNQWHKIDLLFYSHLGLRLRCLQRHDSQVELESKAL